MFTLRRVLVALVVVLALVATGCSSVTGTGDASAAATINGDRIEVADVEAQMALATAGAMEEPEGDQLAVLQAEILQYLVRLALMEQGAAEMGIEFTDEDLEQAREDLVAQFGGEELLTEQLGEQGLEISDLDEQLKSQTIETRVTEVLAERIDVSDEDVREAYDNRYGDRPVVRHILLDSEDDAEEVLAELEAGEDFGEVATARSTDPSAQDNAGELGALQRGQTVPEFEQAAFDAEEGEFVGPVESQFGFHVIEVTGFEAAEDPPEFEDVEGELREQVASQQGLQEAFMDWINDVAAAAEVEVNPRFGEWDGEALAIVPGDPLDSESSSDE